MSACRRGWPEADLAAGHLVRLLADYEPASVPLDLTFQPSRLASPKVTAFAGSLGERWSGVDPCGAPPSVDR